MKRGAWGLLLVGLTVVGLGWFLQPSQQAASVRISCPDLSQPCLIKLAQGDLRLQALSPPSALHPFILKVEGSSIPLTATFAMAGMQMGPLQIPLQTTTPGSQQAQVVLPLCSQGRHDWLLRLQGQELDVEIQFTARK